MDALNSTTISKIAAGSRPIESRAANVAMNQRLETNSQARFPMTLGVFSQAAHWEGPGGDPWAYEPYVREMRLWANLFARVRVFAPSVDWPMKGNLAAYNCPNLEWVRVSYDLSANHDGQRQRLLQLPRLWTRMWRFIDESDFVQLRSPSHLSLFAAVMTRLRRRTTLTKWAGENGAYEEERLPSRLNRWVEGIASRRHPVLVYGPARRSHQIPFIPALMSDAEIEEARILGEKKSWNLPWRLLSVGRLEAVKGFELALRGLGELRRIRPELRWQYTLVGDGRARTHFEQVASECGIQDRVTFTGALPFQSAQQLYGEAHLVIMPGVKEGWPKPVAEAWAHGAVPVAASAGIVPWILSDPDSGFIFEPNPASLAHTLLKALSAPTRLRAISSRLCAFTRDMSLEQFQARVEKILVERCGLP